MCPHLEHDDEESGYRADNAQFLQQSPEGRLLCSGIIVHARYCAVVLKPRVMPEEECQDPCIAAHTPRARCNPSSDCTQQDKAAKLLSLELIAVRERPSRRQQK